MRGLQHYLSVHITSMAETQAVPSRQALPLGAVITAVISGFLFGYDMCVITIALPLIAVEFQLSAGGRGWVVAMIMVGATLGAGCGGAACDTFGKLRTLFATNASFVLSAVVMSLSDSVTMLLLGRVLAGISIGASAIAVSVFLAELAPPASRGVIVACNELALCFGCVTALGISSGLELVYGSWRIMLAVCAIPALLQGMLLCPQMRSAGRTPARGATPPSLQRTQQDLQESTSEDLRVSPLSTAKDAGVQSLALSTFSPGALDMYDNESERLVAPQAAADSALIPDGASFRATIAPDRGTLGNAVTVVHLESSGPTGITGTGSQTDSADGRRTFMYQMLAIGVVAIAQNCAFSNAILYYAKDILAIAGTSAPNGFVFMVGCLKLGGVVLGIYVIHKFKRRHIMIVGSVFESMALAALALTFQSGGSPGMVFAAIGVFVFTWNATWAPLMFVLCAELAPAQARATLGGFVWSLYWLTSIATNATLPVLLHSIGPTATFWCLAAGASIPLLFVVFLIPETKGVALQDVDALFHARGQRTRVTASGTTKRGAV